jgi:outer membrane protein assembly factor BamB
MKCRSLPGRSNRSPGCWGGATGRLTPRCLPLLMLLLTVTMFVDHRPARAQLGWQSSRAPVVDRILMLAPREYQQQLHKAEEAIEREQYSEAIQALAQLLEPRPDADDGSEVGVQEDFFVGRPGDAHLESSLRTEARRLLGRLPARGKELYRLNYGAEAQRQLDQALAARDEVLLAEVAWRYFHTDAGYLANLLLGRHHLDRGRPLAASMCFARLAETPEAVARFDPELSLLLASSWQQAGNRPHARETLEQLQRRLPEARFDLGGQAVNLFGEGEDPLEWLDRHLPSAPGNVSELTLDWQMHRGVPSRNPTSAAGIPLLRHRWRVPLASTPDDDELIHSMVMEQRERGSAAIPSLMPLVVDDVVVVRTPENLLAVDFATGKRIWEYPWGDPPPSSLSSEVVPARNRQQRRHQLEERLWMDCAYGHLSSDGKCVFLVDELSYIGPGASDTATRMFRNMVLSGPDQPQEYNSLVALELETQGKYRWRVGGATGEDEAALARAFFLGPPLVLADSLYVLAEIRGDVSLYVLDAASGRLRWSQQLAHVGLMNILQDPTRRLAGASPSYADGVLVCPTSAGGIVAVDIPTRSLLWGYQYPRSLNIGNVNIRLNLQRVRRGLMRNDEAGWLDSAALIADGRVVFTPVESDELICLDLLTGKPRWSAPRGDELLLLACVDQDQVIVLGDSKVVSLSLDDGQLQWELPLSDPANPAAPVGRPSGKGFLSDHRYYLPTSTRLLIIDLAAGRLEASVDLAEPLGTLVPYGDQIVSLSAESLTTYYQLDRLKEAVQQRLATAANDPWATEHLGLLQLERGDRLGALNRLRQAYRAYAPDDDRREGTRVLLVETLLAVLEQQDDAATDDVIREVDGLIERPLQRERYLRLIGKRMLRKGNAPDAFAAFLELARQQEAPS